MRTHTQTHILNHYLVKLLPWEDGSWFFSMDSYTPGTPSNIPKGKYASVLGEKKHATETFSLSHRSFFSSEISPKSPWRSGTTWPLRRCACLSSVHSLQSCSGVPASRAISDRASRTLALTSRSCRSGVLCFALRCHVRCYVTLF